MKDFKQCFRAAGFSLFLPVLILFLPGFGMSGLQAQDPELTLTAEIEHEEDAYVGSSVVVDDYLYAIGESFGDGHLSVYDISAPGSPELVHYSAFEDFGAGDLLADGSHLYIAGGEGLKIFDIGTNPAAPSLLAEHTEVYNPEDESNWSIMDYIVKKGDLLFANSGLWSMMVLDFSDINNPVFLYGFSFNWYSVDRFVITSDNAGWLDDGNDLRRIDFSNPSDLDIALSDDENDYIEVNGELYDHTYHNDTLYTVSWTTGPKYAAVYKLSERRLIDELNVGDSLGIGFGSSIDYHPGSRRLVVAGVVDFLEIKVENDGSLTPVRTHPGERDLNFHGDLLVTGGGSGAEGYIYSVGPGEDTGLEENPGMPGNFNLSQNYPNPFNPGTRISYRVPEASEVKLEVFDMLGRKISTLVNEHKAAGSYQVAFDASELSSGMYIYTLSSGGGFLQSRKMMLVK